MRSVVAARVRPAVFAVCAACTLWLVVQNAILFTLLPWERLVPPLGWLSAVAHAGVVWGLRLSPIPIAFALGWWISRREGGTVGSGERIHE